MLLSKTDLHFEPFYMWIIQRYDFRVLLHFFFHYETLANSKYVKTTDFVTLKNCLSHQYLTNSKCYRKQREVLVSAPSGPHQAISISPTFGVSSASSLCTRSRLKFCRDRKKLTAHVQCIKKHYFLVEIINRGL